MRRQVSRIADWNDAVIDQLIEQIYESSFLPDLWPRVLHELATIAGARGGVIFVANANGILRWSGSERIREDLEVYVGEGWLGKDLRQPRMITSTHAGFLTDADLFSEEELASDPTIQNYYRARGLGWTAITGVPLPTGDLAILTVEREYANGPVAPKEIGLLDHLRPHLARSALMSARLQMERARAASDALSLIGLPALVFNENGAVMAANRLMEGLSGHVRWRTRDRISLKDRTADALFQQALRRTGKDSAAVGSFAVRDAEANPAYVAHVLPIRRDARDLFALCAGVLILTPVKLPHAPPVELLQSLFDLTPAEARVARSLAAGDTVDGIAAAAAVSSNTVRTQVRGILEKTGLHRQAQVISLLGGIVLPDAERRHQF
jgi:DNA-binding CsgD family transcriptional regulator